MASEEYFGFVKDRFIEELELGVDQSLKLAVKRDSASVEPSRKLLKRFAQCTVLRTTFKIE